MGGFPTQGKEEYHGGLLGHRDHEEWAGGRGTLTSFRFKGVCEYLEDLVSRIDSPRLDLLSTMFFNDIDYNSTNSSVARQPSGHVMRRASSFILTKLKSAFIVFSLGNLAMERSE
jgi:hypothetical protein